LEQLDLVLAHLHRALKLVGTSPEEPRQKVAWVRKALPLLQSGAITEEEYFAGFGQKSQQELQQYVHAWREVYLFTQVFYFVAWRLREIFNASTAHGFPGVKKLSAKGIRDVRNLLIQHPENRKPTPNYAQSLIVTDDGPVLKTSEVLIRGTTGRVTPTESSLDRGLFVNAEELRAELEAVLTEALK
jgi:hypothetical protein